MIIQCDIDGSNSAQVWEDGGAGAEEFDYVGFDQDSIRRSVDEQQDQLRQLGRSFYG